MSYLRGSIARANNLRMKGEEEHSYIAITQLMNKSDGKDAKTSAQHNTEIDNSLYSE